MFRHLSIKRKQMLIIMLISTVALLLASTGFIVHEMLDFRERLQKNLSSLAGLVADNSTAALTFDDPRVAREVVQSLSHEPNVTAGFIFNKKGQVFATYLRGDPGKAVRQPSDLSERYENGEDAVAICRKIKLQGDILG